MRLRKSHVIAGTLAGIIAAIALWHFVRAGMISRERREFRAEVSRNFREMYHTAPSYATLNMLAHGLYIADRAVNHKLTLPELIQSYPKLTSWSAGVNESLNMSLADPVQYQPNMPPLPPVKTAYFLMDELPSTAGKLTSPEKLRYAFLVSCSLKDGPAKVQDIYTAYELEELLREDMKTSPDKYEFFRTSLRRDKSSAAFGVSVSNPVRAASVYYRDMYLSRLRTSSGGNVSYEHSGLTHDESGNIIDIYTLTYSGGVMTLYADPYSAENSHKAPAGLTCQER